MNYPYKDSYFIFALQIINKVVNYATLVANMDIIRIFVKSTSK